jgi:hypothetical protein
MFPQMTKVAIGPTRTNNAVCRLVEFEDGSARVETWRNGAWVPGRAAKASVAKGPPASADLLARLGVPPMSGVPRHDPEPIQIRVAKLRRCLMCGHDFESAWAGERICPNCRGSHAFESGTGLGEQYR